MQFVYVKKIITDLFLYNDQHDLNYLFLTLYVQAKPANSLRNNQTEQINKVKLKSQQDADLLEDLRSVVYLVIMSYVYAIC